MVDIFGTLGPSCSDISILQGMFDNGMTGIRLNLSHTMLSDNHKLIENVKQAAKQTGIKPKILIDLQGPELRIGNLIEEIQLSKGDELTFSDNESCKNNIYIETSIMNVLEKGDEVLIDDGKIKGLVTEKTQKSATICILRGKVLQGRKSILIIDKTVLLPTLTVSDIINIKEAVKLGITGVMLPFVRNKEDIITLRKELEKSGGNNIEIYAKIENTDGVNVLPEIIEESDEIVIARGDLGNSVSLWELPGLQKEIASKCRRSKRRFMVVTQMLSSMEHRPVPTRAEVSDIYNAVLDGATSVMVTGETAIGEYPVEVIRYLCNTAKEAEKNMSKK